MRVLLHVCCGPCTLYPLDILRAEGHEVSAYFHNPNIHPYREFRRRIEALETVAEQRRLALTIDREYGLTAFLRQVVFDEDRRCGRCYRMRLEATVRKALDSGCQAFSTTLLYSRYQQHERLATLCRELGERHGLHFLYHDFRQGWQAGIDQAVAMNIYRQPYCGCIYSEQERYDPRLRRARKQQTGSTA